MKIVRIVLCTLMALAMIFSLIACNKDNGQPGDQGNNQETNQSGQGNSQGDSQGDNQGGNQGSGQSGGGESGIPKSITIGVSGYLGRFYSGEMPVACWSACDAVFDTVFYANRETGEVFSYVLDEWYYEDELTFIMKLKPGIYFSNGEEATAEDLLYSYYSHEERGSVVRSAMGSVNFQESSVLDKYTVSFKFDRPYLSFDKVIAFLICKSWAQEVGWDSEKWYEPVGSGPYYVAEYSADDHITLRLRDDYWNKDRDDYAVEEWIIKYFPTGSTMFMELERGTISMCAVESADYSRFINEGADNIDILLQDMGVVVWFGMGQLDTPALRDKSVRLALAHGVNWEQVGKVGYEDRFIPTNSIFPTASPFYYNPGTHEFNPDLAVQILADAGYGPGDITLSILAMDRPIYRNCLESFQYFCSEIGINVELSFGDVSSVLADWIVPGGSDGGIMYNIDGAVAYDPVASCLAEYNGLESTRWTYIDDAKLLEMTDNAIYCPDKDLQKELLVEVQQYIFDEVMLIPFAASVSTPGYRTDVFTENQIKTNVFHDQYVWLSNLGRASAWN